MYVCMYVCMYVSGYVHAKRYSYLQFLEYEVKEGRHTRRAPWLGGPRTAHAHAGRTLNLKTNIRVLCAHTYTRTCALWTDVDSVANNKVDCTCLRARNAKYEEIIHKVSCICNEQHQCTFADMHTCTRHAFVAVLLSGVHGQHALVVATLHTRTRNV